MDRELLSVPETSKWPVRTERAAQARLEPLFGFFPIDPELDAEKLVRSTSRLAETTPHARDRRTDSMKAAKTK